MDFLKIYRLLLPKSNERPKATRKFFQVVLTDHSTVDQVARVILVTRELFSKKRMCYHLNLPDVCPWA